MPFNAGNSIRTAGELNLSSNNQALTDALSLRNPDDYFRINLNRSSNINLSLKGARANVDLQLIQDLNNNGQADAREILGSSTLKGIATDAINIPLAAGSYYVRVYAGNSGATTNYTLNWSTTSLGNASYTDSSSVKSYFGTSVTRSFFNSRSINLYQSQFGNFLMYGAIADYYSNNYFNNANTTNGLSGVYSGLGLPTSPIYQKADGSQVMEFEGGTLTNRNGSVTPLYSHKGGDRFDLVGQGAPNGTELQWKDDYSWFNPNSVGKPTGSVRRVANGWVQEFTGSPRGDGDSIFLLKDGQQVLGGVEQYTNNFGQQIDRPRGGPYRVQGVILNAYRLAGGYERTTGGLGFATFSAERSDFQGYKTYQAFENGFIGLTYDGRTVIQNWQGQAIATIGYDGTTIASTYANTFNRDGGSTVLGSPTNNVHRWEGGYIQDFAGGSEGRGAIMKSNANNNSYWVGGDFWKTFVKFNGASGLLQYPTSDRYAVNGGWRQDFQGGAIFQSSAGIFPVYGGIGGKYFSLRGNNSFLGLPTSNEINGGNSWVQQNFQGGYILWKLGQSTIAYDTRAINGLPVDSGHGSTSNWIVDFWNNQTMSGLPVYTTTNAAGELRFAAGLGAPVGTQGIQEDHFSARWNTTSYFAGGIYNFTNQADDGVRVYVDNVKIIDKWQDQPFITNTASTFVSQGLHNVRVEYFENQGAAANTLKWDLKNPMNEWIGEFFNNQNLQGQAVGLTSGGTGFLSRDWSTGHEAGIAIADDHFSDRWTTTRFFQGGTYEFSNQADDGVRIWVDDKLALDHWVDQPFSLNKFDVSLSEGYHKIRVEHYENQGSSAIKLTWNQLSNLLNQPNISPSGSFLIPINTGTAGKSGVLAGQADPTFTWNYTGNYNDPLYRAYTNNNQDSWIMVDSDLWDNRHYGSDVPATVSDFKGVTYLFTTFDVPTGATNIKLDFSHLAADDRVVASLNGKQLGAFSDWVDPSSGGQGVMMDGNSVYSSQLFTTTSGSHLFADPSLFNVGGKNVLRFWVNNTGSRDPLAPAKPLANNHNVDTAVLGVVGSLSYDIPKTVSISLPSTSGTSRILDAYQQAGGPAFLGNPVQSVKSLDNGAYELDLPKGQFFWAPGMTNPTYYEYVNGSLTMPANYWRGEYFNNRNWSGDPVLVRGQPYLQEDWGTGSPFASVSSDNFSVRWTSQQTFARGTWQFLSDHDDGFQVVVNGQTAIDRLVNVAEQTNGYASFAQAGQYGVQVKYFENLGLARAKLSWGKASDYVVGLDRNNQLTQAVVDDFQKQGGYAKLGLPQNDVHTWGSGTIQDFDGGANGRGGIMRANGSNDAFWVGSDVWKAFLAKGGAAGVGYPINELHTWGNGVIQDFDGGSSGRGGLMKENGSNTFYWVNGSIWNRYLGAGGSTGILGYPTSDRYSTTGGVTRQNFRDGVIYETHQGTFSVYGGIKDYYFSKTGGEGGKLGLPTSGEYSWNGKTRQNFANGYIVWTSGSGAVGYKPDGSLLFPPPAPVNSGSNYTGGATNSIPVNWNLRAYREDNLFWRAGYAPSSENPPNPKLGNALGNCTWYANGRLRELGFDPSSLDKLYGNANDWDDEARAAGITISHTPQVGAIAQWENGHVAVVEKVNADGTILISESSYALSGRLNYLYETRTIYANNPNNYIIVPYKGGNSSETDDQVIDYIATQSGLDKNDSVFRTAIRHLMYLRDTTHTNEVPVGQAPKIRDQELSKDLISGFVKSLKDLVDIGANLALHGGVSAAVEAFKSYVAKLASLIGGSLNINLVGPFQISPQDRVERTLDARDIGEWFYEKFHDSGQNLADAFAQRGKDLGGQVIEIKPQFGSSKFVNYYTNGINTSIFGFGSDLAAIQNTFDPQASVIGLYRFTDAALSQEEEAVTAGKEYYNPTQDDWTKPYRATFYDSVRQKVLQEGKQAIYIGHSAGNIFISHLFRDIDYDHNYDYGIFSKDQSWQDIRKSVGVLSLADPAATSHNNFHGDDYKLNDDSHWIKYGRDDDDVFTQQNPLSIGSGGNHDLIGWYLPSKRNDYNHKGTIYQNTVQAYKDLRIRLG